MWLVKLRSNAVALLLALAVLISAGCRKAPTAGPADSAAIKIGEFACLTGTEATFGQSSHAGTQLAIDEINAAGGILGRRVTLICEDNHSKAGESATIVRKFISRDKVAAVLGEVVSGRSLEAAPICQENKVLMISPSSTNPQVTRAGDFIFRVCFLDSFQGPILARFARTSLKAERVAILTDVQSPYSVGLAQYFQERFQADGGTIVAERKYSGGDKDFKAQLTAIRAARPDAVFIPGYYTEAGLIALQARQLGIQVPLFGGDGWESPKLVEIGGAAVEGTFYSTHYSPEEKSGVVENFVRKFRERHQATPDGMAALGYDSAKILAAAMQRAGTTEPEKVRNALAATKDFTGVTGRIGFDENRNATKSAVIVAVQGGQFKFRETIAPEPN